MKNYEKEILVIKLFIHNKSVSKTEIIRAIEHTGSVSAKNKAVIRMIDSIKEYDNNIKIRFRRSSDKYSLEEGEDELIEILNSLSNFVISNSILNSFRTNKTHKDIIQYDKSGELGGKTEFGTILKAITERKEIQFRYEKFSGEEQEYTIKPYFLKEHSYKWYIIGLKENDEKRQFLLNRIKGNVTISNKSFDIDESKINIKGEFSDMIGVGHKDPRNNFKEFEKKKIVFQVLKKIEKNKFNKLIEESPIHESQKNIASDNEFETYEVYLRDNYEFFNKLYSLIPGVRLVSPEDTKKRFYADLQKMIKMEGE